MRKRNVQVLFRLNKKEAGELDKSVKKTGFSRETYIRQVLLGYSLKEKPDDRFYDAMRELSAIGNRVNQLAAKANTLGFIDAPILNEEMKKWSEFRLKIKEHFLLPEKVNL